MTTTETARRIHTATTLRPTAKTDSGTDTDSGAADVDTDTNGVDGTDAAGDADGDDGYKPLFG